MTRAVNGGGVPAPSALTRQHTRHPIAALQADAAGADQAHGAGAVPRNRSLIHTPAVTRSTGPVRPAGPVRDPRPTARTPDAWAHRAATAGPGRVVGGGSGWRSQSADMRIRHVLAGVRFPAERWELIACADAYGADWTTLNELHALPAARYLNMNEVLIAVGNANQV